jgi:hypothetical protein
VYQSIKLAHRIGAFWAVEALLANQSSQPSAKKMESMILRLGSGKHVPNLRTLCRVVLGPLVIGGETEQFANRRALLLVSLAIIALGPFVAAQFGSSGASVIGIVALAFASIGIHGLQAVLGQAP